MYENGSWFSTTALVVVGLPLPVANMYSLVFGLFVPSSGKVLPSLWVVPCAVSLFLPFDPCVFSPSDFSIFRFRSFQLFLIVIDFFLIDDSTHFVVALADSSLFFPSEHRHYLASSVPLLLAFMLLSLVCLPFYT